MIRSLQSSLALQPGGGHVTFSIALREGVKATKSLDLPSNVVGPSRFQRAKRQFLELYKVSLSRQMEEEAVVDAFVNYLQTSLSSG